MVVFSGITPVLAIESPAWYSAHSLRSVVNRLHSFTVVALIDGHQCRKPPPSVVSSVMAYPVPIACMLACLSAAQSAAPPEKVSVRKDGAGFVLTPSGHRPAICQLHGCARQAEYSQPGAPRKARAVSREPRCLSRHYGLRQLSREGRSGVVWRHA